MARTCGREVCFHGAFKNRAEAESKATARGGAVIRRKIRRQTRFVVITAKK
jgi:hypothetical protein